MTGCRAGYSTASTQGRTPPWTRCPLSDGLSLLEARSYAARGFHVDGELAVQFARHDGIKCYAIASGTCWLAVQGLDPVQLQAGDCFLLPRGLPFRLATDLTLPAVDAEALRHARQKRSALGDPAAHAAHAAHARPYLVGSYFLLTGQHAEHLLAALPPIVHIRDDAQKATMRWSLERLCDERVELWGCESGVSLSTAPFPVIVDEAFGFDYEFLRVAARGATQARASSSTARCGGGVGIGAMDQAVAVEQPTDERPDRRVHAVLGLEHRHQLRARRVGHRDVEDVAADGAADAIVGGRNDRRQLRPMARRMRSSVAATIGGSWRGSPTMITEPAMFTTLPRARASPALDRGRHQGMLRQHLPPRVDGARAATRR